MNITLHDISHRKNELEQMRPTNAPDGIYRLYDKIVNKEYSFTEAAQVLRYWRELHEDTTEAACRVLDILEAAIAYEDSEEHIAYITSFINEEVSNKVRNAQEFQLNISMKKGKFKSPNRKITTATRTANKDIPDTQEAAKAWEAKHGYHAKPYGGFKKVSDDFVEECYDKLFETALKIEQCDRVLINNENLNKRFNFDKIVRESDDLEDTIELLCEFVNTYDAPFEARYNTALENIFYSLAKNNVNVTNESLIRTITDYFLMTEYIDLRGEVFEKMAYILEEAKLFTESDTRKMVAFLKDEDTGHEISSVCEALDVFVESGRAIDPDAEFRKFKAQPIKDPNIFKSILYRIYAGHPGDVIDNLANIFGILRGLIIVASFAQPVLGIITLVTDYCLKTKYGRKGLKVAIEKYDREIVRVNKKIKKADTDQVKESLKKYRDKLLTARGTLDDELSKLHTEKENDERHEKEDNSKLYDDGEDDFEFDFDFDFEEAVTLMLGICDVCENYVWKSDLTTIVNSKIRKSERAEDFEAIAEFCRLCPDVINTKKIASVMESTMAELSKEKKYALIPSLAHAIDTVNEAHDFGIVFKNGYELYENTRYKKDVVSDMIDFCSDSFNEDAATINAAKETKKYQESFKKNALSSRNKVINAMNTLKRDMVKLTDSERMLSKRVDASLETIRDNIHRTFESENREAVIKGTILPKASACIKIAIMTGATWAINPAVSVIGLLGYIGINKSMRKKERQIIIDDIDIELNMCNRYLKHFEEKGDMEAIRNVMKTQRELQRQRNRLVYNMSMVHNTKPDKLPKLDAADEAMTYVDIDTILTERAMNESKRSDINNGEKLHGINESDEFSFDDIANDAIASVKKAGDDTKDAANYVVNKTKDEFSKDTIASDKKIANKKLTKDEMLKNPELVKRYIEDEESDPVLTLNRIVDVLAWTLDLSTGLQTFVVNKLKKILKSSVNVLDPRVKVAFKNTRSDCEKAINELTKEIAKETDPVKQRQLKNQRKLLQDCLTEVDNKLKDRDMKNIKED